MITAFVVYGLFSIFYLYIAFLSFRWLLKEEIMWSVFFEFGFSVCRKFYIILSLLFSLSWMSSYPIGYGYFIFLFLKKDLEEDNVESDYAEYDPDKFGEMS